MKYIKCKDGSLAIHFTPEEANVIRLACGGTSKQHIAYAVFAPRTWVRGKSVWSAYLGIVSTISRQRRIGGST